jgi:hypothetical protein
MRVEGYRPRPAVSRPISDQERDLIIVALKRGDRARAIAELYNRSEASIRAIAKAAGISLVRGGAGATKEGKRIGEIKVRLPAGAVEMLRAAATRRKQTVETLAAKVLTGVLMRSSMDYTPNLERSLRLAAKYEVETSAEI